MNDWARIPTDNPGELTAWIDSYVAHCLDVLREQLDLDPDITPADADVLIARARPLLIDHTWTELLGIMPRVWH